jgi:hypothetical protein
VVVRTQWRNRDWRGRAIRWAERRLAERGIELAGKPEGFRVRPWATVITLPTDRGRVFFKATWPPQRHEAGTTAALARWSPDNVGVTLAADPRRGWLLLDDAGQRLRDTIQKDRDIRHWHRILPRYAELQLGVAPHLKRFLGFGAPDRRAESLARQYALLLDDRSLARVGRAEGLTKTQERRLRDLLPHVHAWGEEISIVPDSIQHDDLHDGQVFVRDGRYRILDWGDACVSHPFLTMSVVERSIAHTLKLEQGSRELTRLRDVYLEPFTSLASAKRLRAVYPIAIRLGWISRALTWTLVVRNVSAAKKREERGDVPRSLGRFLDPTST